MQSGARFHHNGCLNEASQPDPQNTVPDLLSLSGGFIPSLLPGVLQLSRPYPGSRAC